MKYGRNHMIHESVIIRQKTAILFVFNISEIDLDTHKLLFEDARENLANIRLDEDVLKTS